MPHADLPLVKQLCANSRAYRDPLAELDWAALDATGYWLPPDAISLHGVSEFEALPEAKRMQLSRHEFLAFIQAGLWLEGIFLERLVRQLRKLDDPAMRAYALHEIREEAGHSLMFLHLMEQSGLHIPTGLLQRPRLATLLGRHAPLGGALFWLAVVIGEEIPDKLNRHVRLHGEGVVNPLIHQMSGLHLRDEARHIAHARSTLASSLENRGRFHKALLGRATRLLIQQFARAFYLPTAGIYELAGLAPGGKWRQLARQNPARREFVRRCVEPTLNLLREHGIEAGRVEP